LTEHATAAAGKTPAPAQHGPAPLGSKQAHREATERDKRARRFLLRLSLINWGIAVVAWTISAFLGITSPASIIVYSVLFVIGLLAVIMALLTYLLEKFAHRPPDYEHANLEGDGDEGGPVATGAAAATAAVVAATAAAPAKTDAPAAREAAPAAKKAAAAGVGEGGAAAAPAKAEAAAKADAPAAKEAPAAADVGSKAAPAKDAAPATPAKGNAPAAPAGGDAAPAKGDAPAPPAG
jgi:hypothetical protein